MFQFLVNALVVIQNLDINYYFEEVVCSYLNDPLYQMCQTTATGIIVQEKPLGEPLAAERRCNHFRIDGHEVAVECVQVAEKAIEMPPQDANQGRVHGPLPVVVQQVASKGLETGLHWVACMQVRPQVSNTVVSNQLPCMHAYTYRLFHM